MMNKTFEDVRHGYGAFFDNLFLCDNVDKAGMRAVALHYGLDISAILGVNGISEDEFNNGYSVTGYEFLYYMREGNFFETVKLPFSCADDGCGNTVFYFEAKLPWEIPEWMPKTKDKAKAVINEFVSVLLQQDFKTSFDDIL